MFQIQRGHSDEVWHDTGKPTKCLGECLAALQAVRAHKPLGTFRYVVIGTEEPVVDWPNEGFRFWWMSYKLKPRGKRKVMLIEFVKHEGTEYVMPFQDNNCYPRSMCVDSWNAKFKPCESHPTFEGLD